MRLPNKAAVGAACVLGASALVSGLLMTSNHRRGGDISAELTGTYQTAARAITTTPTKAPGRDL
jgi:hypothetical protein